MGGGGSVGPLVCLCRTSDNNEHMFLCDSQGSALTKQPVDFHSITKCSCAPGPRSFFPLFSSTPSPLDLHHLVFPVTRFFAAWSIERFSLSTFSILHFFLTPPSDCLNNSLQSDDRGWRDGRTERRRCHYCKPLFRMSVIAEI